MKSFFTAKMETPFATYYIDLKAGEDNQQIRNKYSVNTSVGGSAIYLNTLQDCIEWIEFYDEYLQERATETA